MLRLKRESFASRIGFLMVSAGCAIGIGNVWRFPTVTGQYGGGVFVLFYLLFLVLMGAPVLTMELAVGRAGHGSAGTAYRALEPKGSKWHLHGWACLIGCCVLMMYYTTVSGWMLAYFFRFVKGTFTGLTADAVSGVYADLLADPFEQIVWMAITVLLGFFVCSRGLQNGIERIGKWMMGALFVLILVLAVHSFVLPGAGEVFTVPTATLSVTAGLAIIAFCMTHTVGIQRRGLGGYLKSFIKPFLLMLPLNLIEQIVRPFSLALRLYGNLYGEEMVTHELGNLFPLVLPLLMQVLSLLFCLIQAIVFTMLLSIYIEEAIEE